MIRTLILLMVLAGGPLLAAPPGQPYAGLWHLNPAKENHLLNYDLEHDPDAPYNRSFTPPASRGRNPDFKVNPNARSGEGGVTALSSFHAANNNPSQGARTSAFLDYYAFSNWQDLDQLNSGLPIAIRIPPPQRICSSPSPLPTPAAPGCGRRPATRASCGSWTVPAAECPRPSRSTP
jgi:hypothetical protein